MTVVHEDGNGSTIIARNVQFADSPLARVRGLMFRQSLPDDFALVFPFNKSARRSVHMLFVGVPIDVVWVHNNRVEKTKQLKPWRGFGWARADTIIELPAGTAKSIDTGDTIRVTGTKNGGI